MNFYNPLYYTISSRITQGSIYWVKIWLSVGGLNRVKSLLQIRHLDRSNKTVGEIQNQQRVRLADSPFSIIAIFGS